MGRIASRHFGRAARRVLLAALGVALSAGLSHAGIYSRVPQVHVNGAGLQAYFASVHEGINVQADQMNFELLHGDSAYTVFNDSHTRSTNFFFLVELDTHTPGTTLGVYDGHDRSAIPIPVFPDTASPGWYASITWRNSPTRVVVNLFDQNAAFLGSRTYPGGDRNGIGFYLATPHATYFSQDPLNPIGEARCLFYVGTGIYSGSLWVAWEDGDAPADNDFDDSILFVETTSEGPYFTPTQHTTWGALKARFR